MEHTFWQTQEYSKPLFEDLLWSKPEQKAHAGKLVIIGGNSHAIIAPSEAFGLSLAAGIGEVKAIMPDKTRKLLGPKVPLDIELVKSTPSGSFSKESLPEIEAYVAWADATLFAGDIGRNSETAIVLETLANKMAGPQIYTRDSADYFTHQPLALLGRPDTLLVLSLAQLQKYAQHASFATPITFTMGLPKLYEALRELTNLHKASIITQHQNVIIVAVKGAVLVTKLAETPVTWRLKTATSASVWWLQNPNLELEALATAITQTKY